jgi:CD163 antigen
LVGNTTEGQGEVLVGFRGVWGHVCDASWDMQDAEVVCHQLGYKRALIATVGTAFGNFGGPKIWLQSVQCLGREQKLKDCRLSTWGYLKRSCGRAGVVCDDGSGSLNLTVRLVGGQTQASGRVDIKFNNEWGTVCDYGWDINDARVVCRMLGYPTALAATLRSSFGQGAARFWLTDVACQGSEESIEQCQNRQRIQHSSCTHSREAGVICGETENERILVRLSGGVNQSHGLVEIALNGDWRGVCSNNWDLRDAHVVCRMLGYPMAVAAAVGKKIDSYHGSGRQWLDNVGCRGTEATIDKCGHSGWGVLSSSCSYSTGAGVVCRESNETTNIQVRLFGGVPNLMGQVQLGYHGLWGTVCGSNWDIREAQVVCRQLGYDKAVAATYKSAFGKSTGHVWAQSFNCNGEEGTLDECSITAFTISTSCGNHAEDVGVVCGGNLSVRLVGGNGHSTGQVQVGFNNQFWGSICADSSWSNEDATIVCKLLGFERGLRTIGSTFGRGLSRIWLSGVRCNGDEKSLLECVHNGWGVSSSISCSSGSQSAGVICIGNHFSPEIRLVGGNGNSNGYVEIGFNGTWGKVCPTNWDISDAQVACRMLGYQHALAATGGAAFGPGIARRYWITNVNCRGNEQSIIDCSVSGWGGVSCSSGTAGVVCTNEKPNADIRLVDGKDDSQGRIEIGLDGVWGTVCHESWDIHDAEVVCRQLGYSGAMAATLRGSASFTAGTGRIWATTFGCKGEEQSILDCLHPTWGAIGSCTHSSDAGVICHTGTGRTE